MNLFNLFATLTLDNSDYEKKLDQSQKSAGSFSSKVGTVFKTGVRAVAGFVAGVTAAATAIGALVVKFVDAGSEIDDNSQKLGISTEAYQYWSLVLQRAGSDASNLSMVIRNLTTFTQELSEGNGDALLTLQKLGIGYEDFMAMNTEEQLYAIVTALQDMEDQTDKVTIAQDIFGNRVYQELLPLLGMEQGSLEDLRAEFENLGLILSDETIKSIAGVGDSLDNLGNLIKTTGLTIAADFLPEIQNIINAMTALISGTTDTETGMQMLADGIVGIIDRIANSAPAIIEAAGDLILNIILGIADVFENPTVLNALVNVVENLLKKIVEIIPTLATSLMNIGLSLINSLLDIDWGTLLTQLIEGIAKFLTDKKTLNAVGDLIKKLVITIADILPDIILTLGTSLTEIASALITGLMNVDWPTLILTLLETIFEIAFNVIPQLLENVANTIFNLISNLFTKDGLKALAEFGISLAEAIINGLISGVESGANLLISVLNGLLDGISSIWTWAGIPAIPDIPNVTIPRVDFAQGGMFPENVGTLYALAGEDGAEIVARGSRGTGVANIEQIADAQYMAMQDYDLRGAIQQAAVAVVNGIVSGLGNNTQSGGNTPVIVRIGDKDFNGYIVNTVNGTLRAQGRKSLNRVTSYGKG